MRTKSKIKVFLVDDDKVFQKSLQRYLPNGQEGNIEITPFFTGEECLQNLHKNPSIIILDYHLNSYYPHAMNGRETLAKIKQSAPDINIIMLSSEESLDIAIEALKYGAYDYITKNESAYIRIRNITNHIITCIELSERLSSKVADHTKINMIIVMIFVVLAILSKLL